MTRARNITVLGGILFASVSLANLRAEVPSTQTDATLESLEAFFPEDSVAIEATESVGNITLAQHVQNAAPPTVAGPPDPAAQPPREPPAAGPYPPDGAYGPEWTADGACGGLCGPQCGPDCQSCSGTGCVGGPVFIQNGWGDIWTNWGGGPRGSFVAGVEGTFLVPIDEPSQSVTMTDLVTDQRWSGDPRGTLGAGVRTWIGLQKCGWGVRVRYWGFGVNNVDPDPDVPKNLVPTIVENYHLSANVLDFELTQRFFIHCWQIDTAFGARYADLNRYIQTVGYGQVGNGVDLYGLAMGSNSLEGTGFTASIGGSRQIHPCSGWYFYWNFRGSALWADTMASVLTDATAFTASPVASANARNHANASVDKEDVYIAETQIGLEYRIRSCCWGQLAFRGGIEYQYWNTGNVTAQSQSFAFLQGGPPTFGGDVTSTANAHDGDLDLIGFILGLEWTY